MSPTSYAEGMPAMEQHGVVKAAALLAKRAFEAWMESRGMGFIQPSDGGADLFVHRSYLQDGGECSFVK